MEEERVLGDYRIIKQIGQGTLGTVYLAEHRFMKKQFALKVLPSDLSSDRSFIQRFEEEMGSLSSLTHPNIVQVHNVTFEQGVYFLVTDCIVDEVGETTNLGQYLQQRDGLLDEETALSILSQLADALDYAHSKGMIHRGLKLNNVLVSQAGGKLTVYLSDFGLSRIVGTGAILTRTYKMVAESLGIETALQPDAEKLTPLHQAFLQNYQFLAPEQKQLDTTVTSKSDIYAFGVLTYYLLTKQYPEGIFPIPTKWETLIRSCLQLYPEERPETLQQVLSKRGAQVAHPKAEALVTKRGKEALKPVIHMAHLARPETDLDPGAVFNIDSTVKHYTPESKETHDVQPMPTDMVVIQGGTFLRGSNDGNRDETPRHKVILNSYAIDVHPITNEQFSRFLEAMGGEKDRNHRDIIRLRDSRIKRSGGKLSVESGYLKHPVVGVTWYGAVAYAMWVGKRLPTEAEWEIAALGGAEGAFYPYGEDVEKNQANFFSSDTTTVKSYAPNGSGLYDMAGNVYEWCHDWYGYNYYDISIQEPDNPKGPLQGVYRVLRGGCWKSLKEDLRCSRRHRNNPGTVNSTYGFRLAADVQES